MKTTFATLAIGAGVAALVACSQPPARVKQARTAPSAAEAPPASAPVIAEYRLGPGDVVKISVYDNPDLTTEAEIGRDGTIGFPLIGEVPLGGHSRREAQESIAQRLHAGGFVPNPHVTLLISQYHSRQVTVMGEVSKPGNYPVKRATSIAEILAAAGGITAKGSNHVTVIKRDGNGGATRHDVDVNELFASGDLGAGALVDTNDIVFVPPKPVFYIYGEVRQPGAYPLAPAMTVRQALSVGGGLTVRGTERGMRVERRGSDGRLQARTVEPYDRLQANDVVYVPESWF